MPRRKKYPKLPSGWGTIRYLGKGRRNCYSVHPPATECNEKGNYIQPKAICYVDDWYVAFAVLNAWHAGRYKPGDELAFKAARPLDDGNLDEFCRRILADRETQALFVKKDEGKTFAQVYDSFFDWKYGEHAPKKLSVASRRSTAAAFGNFSELHDKPFAKITLDELQGVMDSCTLKKSSLELMKSLLTQMYKFGEARQLCDRDLARHVVIPDAADDEHGVPFSLADIRVLWEGRADPTAAMLVIMCYSGFRISAYPGLDVHLEEGYFQGGVKTAAGKYRIVPIHSSILPLVQERVSSGGLLPISAGLFRAHMAAYLKAHTMDPHTPHDCRHTFSALCEKYGVSDADRKRMLGHSFGQDITNGVYGHRALDDLRKQMELIPPPWELA